MNTFSKVATGFLIIASCSVVLLAAPSLRLTAQDAPPEVNENGREIASGSLAVRLSFVDFVGLRVDEELKAYVVHAYSPEQHKNLTAEIEKYEIELSKFATINVEIDDKRKELFERAMKPLTVEERIALAAELKALEPRVPVRPVRSGERLYSVQYVGSDYIELLQNKESTETVLIPFARVGKVIFPEKLFQLGDGRQNFR